MKNGSEREVHGEEGIVLSWRDLLVHPEMVDERIARRLDECCTYLNTSGAEDAQKFFAALNGEGSTVFGSDVLGAIVQHFRNGNTQEISISASEANEIMAALYTAGKKYRY